MRIKSNVDILNLIQVGITISDENGDMPSPLSTWQFNFNFDLDNDLNKQASIDMLKDCGIDFEKLKTRGINPRYFAEKVTMSGLIINPNIKWICYHGCYDFAYLLKIAMNEELP